MLGDAFCPGLWIAVERGHCSVPGAYVRSKWCLVGAWSVLGIQGAARSDGQRIAPIAPIAPIAIVIGRNWQEGHLLIRIRTRDPLVPATRR